MVRVHIFVVSNSDTPAVSFDADASSARNLTSKLDNPNNILSITNPWAGGVTYFAVRQITHIHVENAD